MMNQVKDLVLLLTEEVKYHESIAAHCRGVEATLWGLEEQASFPENSAQTEQAQLNVKINECRGQLVNGQKLLLAHQAKLQTFFEHFRLKGPNPVAEEACGGCRPGPKE